MPEISRFYGIVVYLLWKDHNPRHIHFVYGDYNAVYNIADGVIDGKAPAKIIAKVSEWVALHEKELLELWEKAQRGEELHRVKPLK
jgi:hypothetical protein